MTRSARLGLSLTVLAWAGLGLAPLVLDDWNIGLLTQYVTYGIFALSLGLIWGQAGILCFGQAIFFGIGAYSMALVTLGKLPWLGDSQWTGLALAVLLPMMLAALLGWIMFQGRALDTDIDALRLCLLQLRFGGGDIRFCRHAGRILIADDFQRPRVIGDGGIEQALGLVGGAQLEIIGCQCGLGGKPGDGEICRGSLGAGDIAFHRSPDAAPDIEIPVEFGLRAIFTMG